MTCMYKDHTGAEHDFDTHPPASRSAMIQRAISHILGNEVASQVVGAVRAKIVEGTDRKAADVSTDEVKGYREAHTDEMTTLTRKFQDEKMAAILAGDLGVRSASVAVDPHTRECLKIAGEEIRAVFKQHGNKFPTGDATFAWGAITLDGQGWINRWLNDSTDAPIGGKGEPNKPRIERLATRRLKEATDRAKAIANASAEGVAGL